MLFCELRNSSVASIAPTAILIFCAEHDRKECIPNSVYKITIGET
jgi:hypothetical protein